MLALSDALLALVTGMALWQVHQLETLPEWMKWPALLGLCIILAAALLGALRFAGVELVTPWHQRLSDLGAMTAMPLLMSVVATRRAGLSAWLPSGWRRAVSYSLLATTMVVGLFMLRPVSGAVALLMLVLALLFSARSPLVPLTMLASLGVLAWMRGLETWPLDARLTLLHLGLAAVIWLAVIELRGSAQCKPEVVA